MGKHKRTAIQAAAEASSAPPDHLEPDQTLARVLRGEGNSLFALELPDKTVVSAQMPDRFRHAMWIKRGGYVLVQLREQLANGELKEESKEEPKKEENGGGRRVGGEILSVVRDVKEWRKQSYWPENFARSTYGLDDDEDDDSNVGKLPPSDPESDGEDEA